jgi:hypothetical protein
MMVILLARADILTTSITDASSTASARHNGSNSCIASEEQKSSVRTGIKDSYLVNDRLDQVEIVTSR